MQRLLSPALLEFIQASLVHNCPFMKQASGHENAQRRQVGDRIYDIGILLNSKPIDELICRRRGFVLSHSNRPDGPTKACHYWQSHRNTDVCS
jgi:hypothetical protein